MLDLARQRIDTQIERAKRPPEYKRDHGIYVYMNALGAETISVEPPPEAFSINVDGLIFLRDHLALRDVYKDSLLPSCSDSVTALTGPICYYDLPVQLNLLENICQAARRTVIIQIKPTDYGILANATAERNMVGSLVHELLQCNVEEAVSRFYTENIPGKLRRWLAASQSHEVRTLLHHGNRFDIYLSPLAEITQAFQTNGFDVLQTSGLGFLSALYPKIVLQVYRACNGRPVHLLQFYRTLQAMEAAFSETLPSFAENCTILAGRSQDQLPQMTEVDQELDLRETANTVFEICSP